MAVGRLSILYPASSFRANQDFQKGYHQKKAWLIFPPWKLYTFLLWKKNRYNKNSQVRRFGESSLASVGYGEVLNKILDWRFGNVNSILPSETFTFIDRPSLTEKPPLHFWTKRHIHLKCKCCHRCSAAVPPRRGTNFRFPSVPSVPPSDTKIFKVPGVPGDGEQDRRWKGFQVSLLLECTFSWKQGHIYPTPWNRRNIILKGVFFGGDDMILFFICDVAEWSYWIAGCFFQVLRCIHLLIHKTVYKHVSEWREHTHTNSSKLDRHIQLYNGPGVLGARLPVHYLSIRVDVRSE